VTVVDICETPLALNRWYAERVGISIATVCSDILDFADSAPFDAICTHSFLGQFPPEERERLIATWRRLLRPRGIAITVNRVRPRADSGPVSFAPAQASALRDAIISLTASMPATLGLDAAALVRAAEEYARRQRPYPVRSLDEIRGLFEDNGFAIERLSCAPVPGSERHAVRGPTVSAGADYASVIARWR
jgi:SAM-dependent methyltransferase